MEHACRSGALYSSSEGWNIENGRELLSGQRLILRAQSAAIREAWLDFPPHLGLGATILMKI